MKTLFLSLARTYKQHKFPFNSMNHAHNHLHDSSSSSLSRRQIKFDLILPPTTRNRKNSILTFCRIVWKRRLAQWTARSVDSWKEGWQSCLVGTQSNQRTRTHFNAENTSKFSKVFLKTLTDELAKDLRKKIKICSLLDSISKPWNYFLSAFCSDESW